MINNNIHYLITKPLEDETGRIINNSIMKVSCNDSQVPLTGLLHLNYNSYVSNELRLENRRPFKLWYYEPTKIVEEVVKEVVFDEDGVDSLVDTIVPKEVIDESGRRLNTFEFPIVDSPFYASAAGIPGSEFPGYDYKEAQRLIIVSFFNLEDEDVILVEEE